MPTVPCPVKIDGCLPCNDEPVSNYSSENADPPVLLAIVNFRDDPPLNSQWSRLGCLRWCFSPVSQEAAEDCALEQAKLCTFDAEDCSGGVCGDWKVPDPGDGFVPATLFRSHPQGCALFCGDLSAFLYFVPAGAVISQWSQADADERAYALACKRGISRSFCSTPPAACLSDDVPYEAQLAVIGSGTVLFELVSGTLPPGMDMNASGNIFGFPLLSGSYQFTVRALEIGGGYLERTMTIVVVEITTPTVLPDASAGTAYSQTLAQTGATGTLNWAVTQGVLPPGLLLDPGSGVISGTPTTDPTPPTGSQYIFTVTLVGD